MIHQETPPTIDRGDTIAQKEAEVKYVIGSGRQAFSYLIEHDGFLYRIADHLVCQGLGVGLVAGL